MEFSGLARKPETLWFQLEKKGSSFTGLFSMDGERFELIGEQFLIGNGGSRLELIVYDETPGVGAAAGGPMPLPHLRNRLRPGLRERLRHPTGCGFPESGLSATTASGIGRRPAPIARQGSLAVSH